MKKILLLGDSIRRGYDNQVRQSLAGQAEVLFPDENCRFAEYMLRGIFDWKNQLKIGEELDLIHWNVGLWDVLRLYGDEPLTPPEVYRHYIPRLARTFKKLFPHAVQIFATSTPIQEDQYGTTFKRYNAEIEQYNKIACEELEPLGVKINDLYPLVAAMPKEWFSDKTHLYTPNGTELMTGAVLDAIVAALGLEPVKYAADFIVPDKDIGF